MAKCLLCKQEKDDCVEIPISEKFSLFFCEECLSFMENGGEIIKVKTLAETFSPELQSAINDWLAYKAGKGKEYTENGVRQLLGKIRNQRKTTSDTALIKKIKMSIEKGYQGICFELGTIPEEDIKYWFDTIFKFSPRKDSEGKAYREFKKLFAKLDDLAKAKERANTIYFNFKKYLQGISDEKYIKSFANWLRDDTPQNWRE